MLYKPFIALQLKTWLPAAGLFLGGEEDKQACKDCSRRESKEYEKGSWPHNQVLRLFVHLFISNVGQGPGCLSCAIQGQELSEALGADGARRCAQSWQGSGGRLPARYQAPGHQADKKVLSAAGSHGDVPGNIILSELNLGLKLWVHQRGNSALTTCPRRQAGREHVSVTAALRISYEKSDVTQCQENSAWWPLCRVKSATTSKMWKPHNLSLGFRGITKKCMQNTDPTSLFFNILAYNMEVKQSVRIIPWLS